MSDSAQQTATEKAADTTVARMIQRIERSTVSTRQALERSLRQLDVVDEGQASLSIPAGWGMAAKAVARLIGERDLWQTAVSSRLEGDGLEAVARASDAFGAASRAVVLTPDWWRDDLGPLIGLLVSDDGPGRLVALRPRALGGYEAIEPETGTRTPVTREIAARISPSACAITPPLPARISGLKDLARFLWPALRPDLWRVVMAGALIGLAGLAVPMATGLIIDELIPSGELALLYQIGAGLVAAALLTAAISIVQRLALLRLDGRSGLLLRAALWKRVLALPAGFFKQYSSGDLGQRISGVEAMRSAVMSVIMNATVTALFSGLYLGLLFYYDARLALVALAIVATLGLITFLTGLLQLKHHKRQAILSGWLSGFVFQVLQGIVKLRVAGAEDRAFARWAQKYAGERSAIMAIRRISNHFMAFSDAYSILALAAIFGTLGASSGLAISPGGFIAFLAAFGALQAAVLGLADAALQIVAVMPDFERARPVLEADPERPASAADPGLLSGAIEISKLTFAYSAGATPVLKDVSLKLEPGAHVAIVGPSGSGKSTLVRLLLGLERPLSGTVLFDGQDLASLDVAAVRRQIGVVLQTGRVFAGTILENIRGATNASLADCLAACEAAGFAPDLATFPMGLHTPLTEGAATISGGQRQRLLIARALVARPKILILDEATSALDNRTQAIVTDGLDQLPVTRIVIAHRLSTVRKADTIVVMSKGTIAEMGSFDELMASGGLFSDLARRQLT